MSPALHHDSPTWATARPILSVLIPFLRDDPTDLLQRLDAEAPALAGEAEVIVLDDGTDDAALTARLGALIDRMTLPVRLISLSANQGRSTARAGAGCAPRWSSRRSGPARS